MTKTTFSKREFTLVFFEGLSQVSSLMLQLDDIIGLSDNKFNDTEMQYAIQEEIDALMDMKIGDEWVFRTDRSNDNHKALIQRTQ